MLPLLPVVSPATVIGSGMNEPFKVRNSYPSARPTGRSPNSGKSSPLVLMLTPASWLTPRAVPVNVRFSIWSPLIVPAPPNKLRHGTGVPPPVAQSGLPDAFVPAGEPRADERFGR